MQIKIKGRCRGEGKTYLWVRARISEGHTLSVSNSRITGEGLPCKLLSLGMVPREGWHEYVLVVFTTKCHQVAVFEEHDGEGLSVSSRRKRIIPLQSTWASRFNGVFRKDVCAKIRNFDWKGLGRQSILTIDRCVDKNGAWLYRGSLFASCEGDDRVLISVFNADGEKLPVKVDYLSVSPASMDDGPDSPLKEFRFSVELPALRAARGNYCFLAGNEDDPDSWCLEALEPYADKGLKERYASAFCDAWRDPSYGSWVRRHRITAKRASIQRATRFSYEPLFSVIVPLYKTPLVFFEEMVESVIEQTYPFWELILVNASPEDEALDKLSKSYAEIDKRIKIVPLSGNAGITENTNAGIRASEGDFLCFFDHDDVLEPDILFEYARAINRFDDVDLLYCDEDKLYPDGHYANPMFKPDFSIDLLRDNNYVCHMLTVRKSLHARLETAGEEFDGAQDHNLVLEVAEQGRRICHVPRVLYHWRISENSTAGNSSSKPYATQAGIRAVEQHLKRIGVEAQVSCAHGRDFRYKIDYSLQEEPLVSLVIPTKGGSVLGEALEAIASSTSYSSYEIVLSADEGHVSSLRGQVDSLGFGRVVVASYAGEYNYSAAVNAGADVASGSYYVLLHDDIRITSTTWLEDLLRHCMRGDVGVVGPMICDFDGAIQQAGLFLVGGEVVPSSPGLYKDLPGYAYRPLSTQNLSAVSGVCLMTSKVVFESVRGLDILFPRIYGEIDYCLKVRNLGLLVVYTPEVKVEHRASMGRGRDSDLYTMPGYYREKAVFLNRWADVLAEGDPYFNRNFSRVSEEACTFKLDSEKAVEL